MAFTLSATAIADGCIFCLAVDEDGTIKEFADSAVNTAKTIDDGVAASVASENWKGVSHQYFTTDTGDNGGFDYDGVRWTAGGVSLPAGAAAGICIGVVCAGLSAGQNTNTIVGVSGVTQGISRNGSGKGQINFGGGGAATTTTLPVDGTAFHIAFNYNGNVSHGDSDAGYGTEAGSFAIEDTEAQGEFGGDQPLTSIGGDNDGNGNQPGSYFIIYAFDNEKTEAFRQTIHADPWDYFFAEAAPPEPGTVVNAEARLSGGSSNYSCDASIGVGKSPRNLLSNILNNLFDPIQASEASAGRTDYRCIYLSNPESGPLEDVELYISASPTNATMTIGLDPAGVNGTAANPANETTAPAGVSFSAPSSGSPLVIGDIPAGEHQAVWIRRVTAASSEFSRNESLTITVRGDAVPTTKSFVLRHSVLEADTRTWRAIGTNKLEDVDPDPDNSETYAGSGGFDAIVYAWSSAVLRQTDSLIELVVIGGGHQDYYGNSVQKFTLDFALPAPDGTWTRLTDPSDPTGGSEASGKFGDGLPRSQHTYDSIDYDRDRDAMFLSSMQADGPAAGASPQCFRFALATDTWVTNLSATGPANPNGGGVGGSNDTRCVWLTGQGKFWYEPNASRGNYAYYDSATDAWTDYIGGSDSDSETKVAVYDHRRHMVYGLGGQIDSEIHMWDLGPATLGTKQATTGDDAAALTASTTAGFAYDILTDTVVAWDGGEALYDMAPATFVWTERTLPAQTVTPTAPTANGTFKRFRPIEPCTQLERGGYIVINDITQDVYLFAADAEEEAGGGDAAIFRNLPLTWWTK